MCRIGIGIEIVLSCFFKQEQKVLHRNKKSTNIRFDIKMYHTLCIHILLIKYMWMNIIWIYCCKFVLFILGLNVPLAIKKTQNN
jgi:hypothetical protein